MDSDLNLDIAKFLTAFFKDVLHLAHNFAAEVINSNFSSYYSIVPLDSNGTVHERRKYMIWSRKALP